MTLFNSLPIIPNQFISQINGISLTIKREELLDEEVSGNKFRKLKYNFQALLAKENPALLTFGGAYSNHLAACASAGKRCNVRTIGIVRGEELALKPTLNPTLSFCKEKGMELYFISRSEYKKKELGKLVRELLSKNVNLQIIPEGGTNDLAVLGCTEILTPKDSKFDVICASVGTGGTLSGLIKSAKSYQKIVGFAAVKDFSLTEKIEKLAPNYNNWEVLFDHTLGGYGKTTPELIEFINDFYKKYKNLLDPIYTGKMVFGIFALLEKEQWSFGKNILIIHSGGLQGIKGVNLRQLEKEQLCVTLPN